ncbi:MAG: tetratricopeptide repeat protein [Rhodobacteraceae bacterium]|nr:tetratricopeptide repeat protein [Paracoccaceae bacterium]
MIKLQQIAGASALASALTLFAQAPVQAQTTTPSVPPTQSVPPIHDTPDAYVTPDSHDAPTAPSAPTPDDPADRAAAEKAAAAAKALAEKQAADAEAEVDERQLSPEERLDRAFERLAAEDEETWRDAQKDIAILWSKSGSPSFDLLLKRGRDALEREDFAAAALHFNDLVNLAPQFAEGWNMRATLSYHQEDYGGSLADIAETLALEPRHFGALSGMGIILETLELKTEALEAYRAALEVNPHMENAQEAVERLVPDADGRPI